MADYLRLPDGLAPPADDGAAGHLTGMILPSVVLPASDGGTVDLSDLDGRVVLYIYPATGRPGVKLPEGWDALPGARGCTPQSCSFRDHHAELQALGVSSVYGISAQPLADQAEAADRLHLPFPLLSDEAGDLRRALDLPWFNLGGMLYLKRMALIVEDGRIAKVFYPVFPPDRNAADVVAYLAAGR
ncbi:redoxin family protein [Aurantimonas aggregata]|uniref:Redoxin family protein n=1 Tax=Aurantimonas aggregata TaxID=2047720 RepID=A0A6L9MFP2_9HYPH|nr:peroxiredoxin [Aurantimonas aggregata]NDV86633.1 redoxin family protein [Aurantimonas aggregata]